MESKKVLVTGVAGFIGFHTANKLVMLGYNVIGIDNINDYYSVSLKFDRLKQLGIRSESIKNNLKTKSDKYENFEFLQLDIIDGSSVLELFKKESFDYVIHLAAQAGVRYSLENPNAYIDSNIKGFLKDEDRCYLS